MRMKNLEQYRTGGTSTNMELGIPVPLTPERRAYRFSPNENAFPRHFVLGDRTGGFETPDTMSARMTHMPGQPGTVCPYSGVVADDDEFEHPEDRNAAIEIIRHAAIEDAREAIHEMFSSFGGDSPSKHVTIRTETKSQRLPKPRFAREDLLRVMICDECGRDYGVFAISLFCPDCGAPNIHLHFAREVSLVRQQVDVAEHLRPEQGELAYRLLGNAHEDVLTAFEATLKTAYLFKVSTLPIGSPAIKAVGNAFQNIEKGQKRFGEFSYDPFAVLDAATLAILTLNIQKRHVIGHNLGIADASFMQHAADAKLGETIPLVAQDILQFGSICQIVVDELDGWLANGNPPKPNATGGVLPVVELQPSAAKSLEIAGLSALAVEIGLWLTSQSEEGYDSITEGETLQSAFESFSEAELAMAVAELDADGYVMATSYDEVPRVRAMPDLFATFDPHTQGHSPINDAVALAKSILAGSRGVDLGQLHEETGWPLRRFNPSIALLIPLIDPGRVGGEIGTQYPCRFFHALPEDRVQLKRFITRSER